MKKIFAFLSALSLLLTVCSCSKSKNSSQADHASTSNAELLGNIAYKKSSLELSPDINMIFSFLPYNGSTEFLILGSGETTPQFWLTDKEFQQYSPVDIPDFDVSPNYNIAVSDSGTIVEFDCHPDFGGKIAQEDVTFETDFENADFNFRISTFSTDGKLLTSNDVQNFGLQPDITTNIADIASDDKIAVVNIGGTYYVFKLDGTFLCELSSENGSVDAVGTDCSGKLVCCISDGNDKTAVCMINDDGTVNETGSFFEFTGTIQNKIYPGTGDYSVYIRSMSAIFGIRRDDSSIEPVFGINKSGLTSDKISDFCVQDDGSFVFPIANYNDYTVSLKRFAPCDPKELEDIQTITIGSVMDDFLVSKYVEFFNSSHSEIQAEIVPYYTNADRNFEKTLELINQDMLSGDLPDILCLDGTCFGNTDVIKKELVYDMSDFLNTDTELNRDKLVPSVMNYIETISNGKAYFIPESVEITLPYTAKTKFAGDINDWNLASCLELVKSTPDDMGVKSPHYDFELTNISWQFKDFLSFDSWIDFDNAECSFDSQLFIDYISYLSHFDEPAEPVEGMFSDAKMDEISKEYEKVQGSEYRLDKCLFMDMSFGCYADYLINYKGSFGGEDVVTLGRPEKKGTQCIISYAPGMLAISKNCENPELAWDFIKYCRSDSFYKKFYASDKSAMYGFPATKSGLEIRSQHELKPKKNLSPDGQPSGYTGETFRYMDKIEEIGRLSKNEIAEMNKLIDKAVPYNSTSLYLTYDNNKLSELHGIYEEETIRCFKGECSAEECAEILQDRISTYLSEQFK